MVGDVEWGSRTQRRGPSFGNGLIGQEMERKTGLIRVWLEQRRTTKNANWVGGGRCSSSSAYWTLGVGSDERESRRGRVGPSGLLAWQPEWGTSASRAAAIEDRERGKFGHLESASKEGCRLIPTCKTEDGRRSVLDSHEGEGGLRMSFGLGSWSLLRASKDRRGRKGGGGWRSSGWSRRSESEREVEAESFFESAWERAASPQVLLIGEKENSLENREKKSEGEGVVSNSPLCLGLLMREKKQPAKGLSSRTAADSRVQIESKPTTAGTPLLTDGDPVGKVRESTTTVVTPHTNYGDPVGKVRESTTTVVTPHTNYGDPVGRVRTGKPTAVTPHTDYGDPVEKKIESTPTVVTPHTNYGDPVGGVRESKPTVVTPHTDYGDPVGKETESTPTVVTPHTNYGDPVGGVKDTVAPRKITLIAKSDFSTAILGGRTFPERNWISCTESNSSGDSFGSRVMACVASTRSGGRTKSFSVSAGRDPVFPSEVTTYFSLSYIFLIQEEGEMCSVGTTIEEGEEETGKVKVLATVDLACGGLLSTASELCTACLIIPLVLRESASCHSSPELRGSGTTTGGTTGSSLDVVGVPTSITWGATPKAVNCAVIVAMALAISAICACNCNTVASVSTERGGPPCAEVEGTSASPCSSISSSISLCSSDVPRLVTTQTR
ncbi:hypothetical protein M5K25_020630 [Dendrobium thyrsiflorum]|uniref:Uncharacterized protein n=1 Tax=Dendrobium thyrsiflorum TaxID=117978 RepID=A0ABD0UAC6_DENTH